MKQLSGYPFLRILRNNFIGNSMCINLFSLFFILFFQLAKITKLLGKLAHLRQKEQIMVDR